ncbi:AGCS family alanine or glycine:sodium (Na+) or proton (H+) symporter [Actinomyces denticolens]|nr:AGCS family alanine or glycine:sodium (Na+) or proton (H+) symporter [Actinomyces denticolens]
MPGVPIPGGRRSMDALAANLQEIADWITAHITMWVLVGTGIILTIATRGVQVRHLGSMIRQVRGARSGADGGISSFQAFAISLAARVGIGNVFGVAAALLMGGPGAIFWMWVVALVGMATAFFEATVAQIFKVRSADGSFRGGPAFYMTRGMGSRPLAVVFSVISLVTCGFIITSVQSNSVAGTLLAAFGADDAAPLPGVGGLTSAQLVVAALIFVFTAMVVFGGVRAVARVTEWMAPIMALIYICLVVLICLTNIHEFVGVLGQIVRAAFAPSPSPGAWGAASSPPSSTAPSEACSPTRPVRALLPTPPPPPPSPTPSSRGSSSPSASSWTRSSSARPPPSSSSSPAPRSGPPRTPTPRR